MADEDSKDVFLNGSLMKMPPKIRRFILFDEKKESDCITKIKCLLISEIKDLFCGFFFLRDDENKGVLTLRVPSPSYVFSLVCTDSTQMIADDCRFHPI